MQAQPPKQLTAAHVQGLQHLLQQGQFQQAEAQINRLLADHPKALVLYNLLGVSQQAQGKLRDAVASFRKMLAIDPRLPEIPFNLGVLLAQLGETKDAIACYRKTLQLKPGFTVAHFNLGILLQAQGQLQEAAAHYRQALALEPSFIEALGNLGTVLQLAGQLEEAEQCYRQALALRPDALGHFNLGTTLYGQGKHEAAVGAFRQATQLDPQFADAWNSLGETLRDLGDMPTAIQCYRHALAAQPKHSRATYNLGEYFCLAGQLLEAIPYFEASDFADAPERALQCYYQTRQFEVFKAQLDQYQAKQRHDSVLMGALSTHYASNFGVENTYNFCKQPMDYVRHTRIAELAAPNSPFLAELLHSIEHLAIAERKQGRLYYGIQSAGNLLMRPEAPFQTLAKLISRKVVEYRQHFKGSTCELITRFPREVTFASSWYLRMKQGGYLTSHIHEEGWISGCVYLKLPNKNNGNEGNFAYSTHGDDYPCLHDDFPSQIANVQVGDLVLFPSSLFHRTLPFQSDQERVCVAFDVKPGY